MIGRRFTPGELVEQLRTRGHGVAGKDGEADRLLVDAEWRHGFLTVIVLASDVDAELGAQTAKLGIDALSLFLRVVALETLKAAL